MMTATMITIETKGTVVAAEARGYSAGAAASLAAAVAASAALAGGWW